MPRRAVGSCFPLLTLHLVQQTACSGSYTVIDNLLNDHFWTPAVQFLPIWMAPNLVTMLGTCIMMFTTLVQLAYSPHFSEPAPAWVRRATTTVTMAAR